MNVRGSFVEGQRRHCKAQHLTRLDLTVCLQLHNRKVFWTKAGQGSWKTLKNVLMPDKECRANPDLLACLQKAGFPVVSMPDNVISAIAEKCPDMEVVSPDKIRQQDRRSKLKSSLSRGSVASRKKVRCLAYPLLVVMADCKQSCPKPMHLPLHLK